jgi:hypothetical protein
MDGMQNNASKLVCLVYALLLGVMDINDSFRYV